MSASSAQPGAYVPQKPVSNLSRKVLLLDRDGVINVNLGYVCSIERTQWIPGIFELARAATAQGYELVVITNQAGIARGYYTEDQFLGYTRWVHDRFQAEGAPLLATYYCPHHPEAGHPPIVCECRKPKPGMILAAAHDLNIDLAQSALVGDQPSDLEAGKAAGVERAYLLTGGIGNLPIWFDLGFPRSNAIDDI